MSENDKHTVDQTTKTLTIIGLVVEFLGVIGRIYIFSALRNLTEKLKDISEESLFTEEELTKLLDTIHNANVGIIVFSVITSALFIVSIVLFYKLLAGNLTEKQSKKVYTYQRIWGIINIVINPIVAVSYISSGIRGRKGIREESNQRTGI
jgi:hypothetical protein